MNMYLLDLSIPLLAYLHTILLLSGISTARLWLVNSSLASPWLFQIGMQYRIGSWSQHNT